MKSFRHLSPELRIHQGTDCLKALQSELDRAGSKRAVIFCGSTLACQGSSLDLVREAMGDRLLSVYGGVRADTPLSNVEEAVRELRRMEPDAIVGVGGGSAMTTARAVNILYSEHGHARDLCTKRLSSGELKSPKLMAPKLPILALPTTPTSATVKAGSAILDTGEGRRLALFDPKARARAVFIHPSLVQSAPRQLVVSAALNTLALGLEGLMSLRGDPVVDALLIHAIRLLSTRLPNISTSDDLDARADLIAASILCGRGSDHTGAGMAIPIGHAIATRFDVEMGISDSIMLPHVLRFNAEAAKAGMEKIATALGVSSASGQAPTTGVVQSLQALFASVGVPQRLRDVGVTQQSLAELSVISLDDWYLQSNPRPIKDVAEIQQILEEAW